MAVTLDAADFENLFELDRVPAEALLAVVTEVVVRYSPNAPEALQNEAAKRYAGYLHEADFGAVRSERLGEREVQWASNHAAAFRNSGAEALLTRYRVRRGGQVAGS